MIHKIRVNLKECEGCDRAAQDSQDWTNGHDHEGSMAKGELKDLILNAVSIYKMLGTNDQLPGWTSAYISLASDYIHSVKESLSGQLDQVLPEELTAD